MAPVVADLDGDGRVDLAAASGDFDAPVGTVSVFLNACGGTFATPVAFSISGSPGAIAGGDLDGDGDTDLVVAWQ